ncbi:hypothetical protein Pfo_010155 [Paulownia fortunei]|nr:hypothetical protein Pfo_010155 [Paulownia fortunei]
MLDMMDRFLENPFQSASRGIGSRRGWDDQVKVSVEQNTLVIKGEGEKESEDEEYGRRFSSRIDLPANSYKLDGIKAEMKNGVLKVVVPKVKEEERKDVFQVSVE